jgi:ATP sulfurylase
MKNFDMEIINVQLEDPMKLSFSKLFDKIMNLTIYHKTLVFNKPLFSREEINILLNELFSFHNIKNGFFNPINEYLNTDLVKEVKNRY